MKNLKLFGRVIFVAVLIALTALGANAQFRTGGDVVEVIDAKTVVVSVPTGLVTVELQYIDVPEVGQSLHAAMKDHVRTLLMGKAVEIHTKGLYRGRLNGKLILDGVDVSQQLLRNGAAWHLGSEMSGQKKEEFAAYAESEELARLEKRGVWSVAGLEPAWLYRDKLKATNNPPPPPPRVRATASTDSRSTAKRKGYWSDENPRMKNTSGLSHGFNAATQNGFLGMALFKVTDDKEAAPGQTTAVDIIYYYTETAKGRTGYVQVTVLSLANRWRFLRQNALMIEADGKKYVVGKPKREAESSTDEMSERLTYRTDIATLERIAYGGDVKVKVGDYYMIPRPMVQMLLYKLLQAAK